MTNEEAIKYLIASTATSTEPSAEYLKQKEAYDLAIKALEEVEEWRKLTAVCAFDGYVIYKDRSEVSDISKIEGYCDTCKHNDGYPTSEVCQYCGAFHHYERAIQND